MRRDVDDAAAAAPFQVGKGKPSQPNRREEQELDGFLDQLVGQLDGRARRRAAAVVHHDVDSAESLHRGVHQPHEVLEIAYVTADGEPADPRRFPLERLRVACKHRDAGALAGQALGGGEPQSGRGAADDRGPAVQP